MVKEFAARRKKVLELVNEIPGIQCPIPEGAFYVFPDISSYFGKRDEGNLIRTAADFSLYLLHKAHVSSVMGDAFGEPKCVRFSFANSMQNIEEGWKRIKKALAELK